MEVPRGSKGGLMQFCTTHMAPRVWTGEDNCVYRASWKPSYPDPCDFQWARFSFDVSDDEIATWISRTHTTTDRYIHAAQDERTPDGQEFVWCVEHDRPVSMCRRLALDDFGQPAFDNCQWTTEAEGF